MTDLSTDGVSNAEWAAAVQYAAYVRDLRPGDVNAMAQSLEGAGLEYAYIHIYLLYSVVALIERRYGTQALTEVERNDLISHVAPSFLLLGGTEAMLSAFVDIATGRGQFRLAVVGNYPRLARMVCELAELQDVSVDSLRPRVAQLAVEGGWLLDENCRPVPVRTATRPARAPSRRRGWRRRSAR